MIKEDFYSGEPVITGSPPTFSNDNIIGSAISQDEIEATNMAAFGKYDYDPGARQVVSSPVSIYPGADGYNQYPMNGGFMTPPQYGIGANPYGQYSSYGNLQPTYNQFRPGGMPNPVFQQGYGYNYSYQQPPQQQSTYFIPGVGMSGEYMPPADYEQRIQELQAEYWNKQQELEVKQYVDRSAQQSYFSPFGGYNYYGTPFYNPYQYNGLNNELMQKVRELEDEARENRMHFNLQIAQLAHNFSGQTISQDALEERYRGKTVNIPTAVMSSDPREYYEQARLASMVPFDNSQVYRDFHASVSKEFHDIVKEDANLKETFDNMGIISAQWEMEDEMHRRKDAGNLYNASDNSYKYFVRKKAQERYCKEKGIQILPNGQGFSAQQVKQNFVNSSQVLSQSTTLSDDGTLNVSLNIPCNVGTHMGETYSVHNSQEAEYNEKRERFGRFLDSIPGSIYLDNQKAMKMENYSG